MAVTLSFYLNSWGFLIVNVNCVLPVQCFVLTLTCLPNIHICTVFGLGLLVCFRKNFCKSTIWLPFFVQNWGIEGLVPLGFQLWELQSETQSRFVPTHNVCRSKWIELFALLGPKNLWIGQSMVTLLGKKWLWAVAHPLCCFWVCEWKHSGRKTWCFYGAESKNLEKTRYAIGR